jgi:hypothetical protein
MINGVSNNTDESFGIIRFPFRRENKTEIDHNNNRLGKKNSMKNDTKINSLREMLFCFWWSTCPLSALSFLSLSSWASTRSLNLLRRSLSACTLCWRASCSFRYLNLCSLAASSWCCESIWACCLQAISRSSLNVNCTPSGN